ncbi:MAG TPA: hypothetical protein EYO31_00755 [Phycisphaerales bacterium]|nr:hypothetical protein [Phycisphaerales bacterium]
MPVASVEFFATLQRVLLKHGTRRPKYVPAQTWIESLGLEEQALELATSLTESYYQIRFGDYRPSRTKRLELMQTVRKFESLVQKGKI